MAKVEILLPAMGEGIVDATLTKWLVQKGDQVEEDQSIAEIATDKVDSELPAPEDGIIEELLFEEGDVPQVGQAIAILKTEGEEAEEETSGSTSGGTSAKKEEVKEEKSTVSSDSEDSQNEEKAHDQDTEQLGSKTPGGKFLSPLVRSIAEKENVSIEELDNIRGSSNTGRITKKDILSYLDSRKSGGGFATQPSSATGKQAVEDKPSSTPVEGSYQGDYEIVKMDRMRKLIADHMVESKRVSPHVTSFVEADVTNLVKWRNANKKEFQEKENTRLTFTPLFIEATVKALKDFPMINVSVDDTNIIVKKNINIGMATALPSGNLIVPVIKNADKQNLLGLASSVNDLAERARDNKLKPEEIQGGTFTITNFGTFGNISGTPIINQPQVAILGVGSIDKKPAVIETEEGDMIGIRHKMILSLAYDHRVVDGALGGMFLKRVADYLEDFDTHRKY